MGISWAQALSWRMRRQLLDPIGSGTVADVVTRLGAVPAWPDAAAELGIAARRTGGRDGDAAAALAAREVVKVFAFRGGMHLMDPADAGAYLAVRSSGRMWELKSWVDFYDLAPEDWPAFRAYVGDALADGPLRHTELVAALRRSRRFRRAGERVAEGNDTLLKPLTWQGVMGFGPPEDGEPTFVRLSDVPGWAGVPDLDEAGPAVVQAHLRTYGPATAAQLHDRFGKGLGARGRAVATWLDRLADRVEEVTVGGDHVLVLAEDVDDLRASAPSSALVLLPGRDPWVMAPGTTDEHVVPPARREVVSRSANLVVRGGVLSGTWTVRGDRLEVTWFAESGRVPRAALDERAAVLAAVLGRPLTVDARSSAW